MGNGLKTWNWIFASIFKRVVIGKARLYLLDSFNIFKWIMDMVEEWISVDTEKSLSIFQSDFK